MIGRRKFFPTVLSDPWEVDGITVHEVFGYALNSHWFPTEFNDLKPRFGVLATMTHENGEVDYAFAKTDMTAVKNLRRKTVRTLVRKMG